MSRLTEILHTDYGLDRYECGALDAEERAYYRLAHDEDDADKEYEDEDDTEEEEQENV